MVLEQVLAFEINTHSAENKHPAVAFGFQVSVVFNRLHLFAGTRIYTYILLCYYLLLLHNISEGNVVLFTPPHAYRKPSYFSD